jgi:predicted  nucleic acid-binding Zn-ribbon protein
MNEPTPETESFSEDDLFFTCPHCGKNMAIEKCGMGLTIQCPDCRGLVKVPKLSEAELKKRDNRHVPAESDQPESIPHIGFLEEIFLRLQGIQKKHKDIEKQFNHQQSAVQNLQEEVQTLQNAMDHLTRQMSDSAATVNQ